MTENLKSTCKHCGQPITHYDGRLWHDSGLIFPQYCRSEYPSDQLHEPSADNKESKNDDH